MSAITVERVWKEYGEQVVLENVSIAVSYTHLTLPTKA